MGSTVRDPIHGFQKKFRSYKNSHVELHRRSQFPSTLDAFDQWCLRRIIHIPYTAYITNEEVRRRTGQPPVTSVIAETTSSVRTSCESRPITRPLAYSSSSHQSSSSGLATPGRSTKADVAPYNRARPSVPQPWS